MEEGEGGRIDAGEAKGGEWDAATQAHARYTGRRARPTARRPLSPWHTVRLAAWAAQSACGGPFADS